MFVCRLFKTLFYIIGDKSKRFLIYGQMKKKWSATRYGQIWNVVEIETKTFSHSALDLRRGCFDRRQTMVTLFRYMQKHVSLVSSFFPWQLSWDWLHILSKLYDACNVLLILILILILFLINLYHARMKELLSYLHIAKTTSMFIWMKLL